jgi:uncharacterized protein (TIGR00730 family)
MHRICIFAASRDGSSPEYLNAARTVGATIARRGWGIVYGGAGAGIMGAMADAALAEGGEVYGVIPESMVVREVAHARLTKLWVVSSMHERKAQMHALADAFLALPGGCGTLDETFEAITWMQLGLHDKPIGLFDVKGYWQPIKVWLDRAVSDGFVLPEHAQRVHFGDELGSALDALVAAPRGR